MKALIIEDEPQAAARLQKYVRDIDPTITISGILESIESAVSWFGHNPAPDLVFMDIHLSDGNCFEIFDQVDVDCPIIFATAYDEYALRSFQHHSIDYILKPIKKADLERALSKLRHYVQNSPDETVASGGVTDEEDGAIGSRRFLIKVGAKINLIRLDEIAYFYSRDKITFAITREGRRFPLNKSLEALESELPSEEFFRINRKFIIHMDSIGTMSSHTKGRVKIDLVPPVELETIVSTERSPHFKKWLLG
ncbi:MAG: response regulator transcription factor [Saprospiraceae bacterium]|nr:response regulator transcription factor [Saprospiraceae bacterium]